MKAIIFNSETEVLLAVEKCTNEIDSSDIAFIGNGPHLYPSVKPYTTYFKHPEKNEYALIADAKVEMCLGKIAIELSNDWISNVL